MIMTIKNTSVTKIFHLTLIGFRSFLSTPATCLFFSFKTIPYSAQCNNQAAVILQTFSQQLDMRIQRPVIMLSARGEEYDRIHGFEIGVDDYVGKPFSPKELMMRVSAILKRYHGDVNTRKKDIYTYEGLKIDFTARKVFIDDKEVEMSPKEYVLLFYLVRNEGIALTREKLLHDDLMILSAVVDGIVNQIIDNLIKLDHISLNYDIFSIFKANIILILL